ncbi:MAG: 4Fe-4S binding protein [Chloroflexi bacterium]|nr:4Fe-4S binding protein [Chloroflexota bacterium]
MMGANYRVPLVDADKCRTCRQCIARKSCRLKALVQFEQNELPYIDQALCRGCLVCVDECPFRAIMVETK